MFVIGVLLFTDLTSAQAKSWYSLMLAEGGYGRLPREQAAFLIRERDGSLTLQPWADGAHRRASFRGAIPPRALAVVHTHPADEEQPSRVDRSEATRLGMPVLVITPSGVIAAMPGGRDVVVMRN